MNCSYLKRSDLNSNHFTKVKTGLSIFHNNIRSLNHCNFEKVKDLFRKCGNKPDILAFSEIRIKDSFPEYIGYNFEHVNSMTTAGGVGVFSI